MAEPAMRVALLARPGTACDRLQAALLEAGAEIVHVADPNECDARSVADAGAQAVLVALEPSVEDALERFDAMLSDPAMIVIFDEAELAAKREGWDAARWVRHLAAKLHRHDDVLPPGSEIEAHLALEPGRLSLYQRPEGDGDLSSVAGEAMTLADGVPRDQLDITAPLAGREPAAAPAPSMDALSLDALEIGERDDDPQTRDRFRRDLDDLQMRIADMGLVDPPGRIVEGSIRLDGRELTALDPEAMRSLRGNRVAMIFQDPMMTLNPVLRIDAQMIEAILAHEKTTEAAARARARDALARVGIPSPDARLAAYPHQFSGGMRQRVAIAIAMLNRPDLIIADEPTTALDVTIQGQILYEMQKLARETGAALIWITHDLSVIAGLADRVCVMYAGRIVEQGSAEAVLGGPRHPYTRGLLDSVPSNNTRGGRLAQIPGMTPSLLELPPGCPFRERCPRARPDCAITPEVTTLADGRALRCHYPLPATFDAAVLAS